jgi:hypothetical protein
LYRRFSWVQVIKIFQSSFHFITPIRTLLIANRKRRSFNPLLKLRRAYTVNIDSRADLGQWQFLTTKILLSTKHAWNKEGVAWSQKWLLYHLPEGYSGVTGVRGQRQNKSNWTPGISPIRWRRAWAYIDITPALNLNIQLSLSLAQQFLFETFSCFKLNPVLHTFLSFFSCCTTLKYSDISFLFTNLIIYIEIWQIGDRGYSIRGHFADRAWVPVKIWSLYSSISDLGTASLKIGILWIKHTKSFKWSIFPDTQSTDYQVFITKAEPVQCFESLTNWALVKELYLAIDPTVHALRGLLRLMC